MTRWRCAGLGGSLPGVGHPGRGRLRTVAVTYGCCWDFTDGRECSLLRDSHAAEIANRWLAVLPSDFLMVTTVGDFPVKLLRQSELIFGSPSGESP